MNPDSFGNRFNEVVDPALWLVTSAHDGQRGGLIATFVMNASLVPGEPRVLVGIAKHHFTWGLISQSRAFALHLVDRAHAEWVRCFGLRSGHKVDKFAGLTTATGSTGTPTFDEACLWAECLVEAELDTGDRSVFLGRVVRCGGGGPCRPLTTSALSDILREADLREMQRLFDRDVAIDATAIAAWRADRGEGSQSGGR